MSNNSMDRARYVRGSDLCGHVQAQAKARFAERYTGDHTPKWATQQWKDGRSYPLQFANDADWLANTMFAVTLAGFLDQRVEHCHSQPTWPQNPELRPTPPSATRPGARMALRVA